MPLTVRILFCTIGAALLFLSSFVYEDGEKNIQSRLEDYWIKIDEQRIRSLATEKHILARLAALATRVLDGLLGKELVSLRAVIISTAISWSSFLLVFPLVLSITEIFFHRPLPISFNPLGFTLNALWATLLILLARKHTLAAIPLWIAPIIYMGSRAELMHAFPPETVISIFVGFALSVAADLLISVVARLLFRKIATLDNLFISTFWCSLLLVMAVAITYGPILANDQWGNPDAGGDFWRRPVDVLVHTTLFLNLADFVFLFWLAAIIAGLIAHRALWHTMLKPLYSLQRTKIFSHKKETSAFALALMVAGLPKNWFAPAIDVLKKLFGG